MSGLMIISGPSFAQSPPGCNANNLTLDLQRDKLNAVPGETVNFTATVSNPAAGGTSCDTIDNHIELTCPGPTGAADGPVTVLADNADYPAGTLPIAFPPVPCIMPNIVGSATAKVTDSYTLVDNEPPSTGQSALKTITVNIQSCAVLVDKQISCDGGATWVDAGLVSANNDGTNACSALTFGQILVRYQVNNAGSAILGECTLTESNPAFGVPNFTGQGLAAGQTVDVPGTSTAICSDAVGNEPNTARVSCNTCGGFTEPTPITASDIATFQCLTASLLTDRRVNCGGGFVDPTLVASNEDGTNGCTAPNGGPVNWAYSANNTGTATLFNCELVDSNPLVSPAPIIVGNLAPGALQTFPATNTVLCSDELELSEPGTITLACCTANIPLATCEPPQRVQVFDTSTVTCSTPGLNVTKLCDATGAIAVTAENTGDAALENCVATDTVYLDSPTCPPDAGATGTPVPLTPADPFALGVGGTQDLTGSVGPLTADACNTVSVTCDIVGTVDSITRTASDVCEGGQGCLTRTPGFWGTHPAITAQYLPLEVCGTDITNVLANNGNSAIEAMCSVGKDGKILGPQLTQLIRQCTAAYLNVTATADLGGNCNSGATAGIDDVLAACCGGDSVCTGDTVEGFSVNSCISRLDDFNNSLDTLPSTGFPHGKAQPTACQDSKNNGVVVSPTP